MTAEPNGEGERRRRRRGRRGGRRNRRGREGEGLVAENGGGEAADGSDGAEAVEFNGGAPSEPASPGMHAPDASPDHGRAHIESEPPTPHVTLSAAPEPPLVSQAPVAAEPAISEPPRRRSTVREPAPQAGRDDGDLPAPSFTPPHSTAEPVISSPAESEGGDRPRRSGWWSKRVFGKG